MPNPGRLFLVVGPSGVGKDSLIDFARDALANDDRFVFPKRAITRPTDAGGEDHDAVTQKAFEETARAGGFVLHWRAHGLRYGIPSSITQDLDAGRFVTVNVSRTILDQARGKFARITVLSVTTQRDVLTERLRGRGRETELEIQNRVARADAYDVSGDDVILIDNSGDLRESEKKFLDILLTG